MRSRFATSDKECLSATIIKKALSLGSSLAGIASAELIRKSPSHLYSKNMQWPSQLKSVVVLALKHEITKPYLDWWDGNMGTPGNRKLASITRHLKKWFKRKYGLIVNDAPYYIQKGGIFLKDSAVCAGLGVIGKNNLLITPNYGPRVRLRALFVNTPIEPTQGAENFSPCNHCDAPCIYACPQKAFETGSYDRLLCQKQMELDEHESTLSTDTNPLYYSDAPIKYCRACELACPVGQKHDSIGESSSSI